MKRFVVALCVLASGWPASSQSELPPRVLQLAELKRNIKTRLARLPNYTCLETIERSQRKNARQAFRYLDTVRVEVAAVKDREVYAWPGATEFGDRDITEIVGAGMIGGGSFAEEIRSIFVNNASTIIWHGEEQRFGRRALRWDYRIPYNLSGWTVRTGKTSGRVSAAGAFGSTAKRSICCASNPTPLTSRLISPSPRSGPLWTTREYVSLQRTCCCRKVPS